MSERGMNIHDAVRDMKLKEALRKNEEYRNRKFRQKKEKAYTEGAVQTSSEVKNTFLNYTTDEEECQDVKSDTPGDNSGGEVRQQGSDSELPVHLL